MSTIQWRTVRAHVQNWSTVWGLSEQFSTRSELHASTMGELLGENVTVWGAGHSADVTVRDMCVLFKSCLPVLQLCD